MPKASRLLSCLLLCSTSAFAQSMLPGLWSVQSKMGGNPEMEKAMAEMQKQLASMPPAQRKQMEAMMGKNGMGVAPGGGFSLKVCVTPEMAARAELPSQTEGSCTNTITSRQRPQDEVRLHQPTVVGRGHLHLQWRQGLQHEDGDAVNPQRQA